MSEAAGDRITVRCPCGTKLKVPRSSAGRRAKCPKCAQVFVVPKPEPAAPAPPETTAPAASAPTAEKPPPRPTQEAGTIPLATKPEEEGTSVPIPCPGCSAPLPPGARLCVMCGYDTQTGRAHKAAKEKTGSLGRLVKAAGPVPLGTVLSVVGATIGAGIWFGVALATAYEVAYIGIALGGLAGAGMYIGARGQENAMTGLIAAAVSILGILVAKVFVFIFVMPIVLTGETQNIHFQREYVTVNVMEEILEERDIYSQADREAHWDEVADEAYARVDQLSNEDVRGRWAHYREQQELARPQEGDGLRRRLAWHEAARKAERKGLAYNDDRREGYFDEAFKKHRGQSGVQLESAIGELDAWEKEGKWGDAAYVRDFLIYQHIDQVLEQQASGEDEDGEYPELTAEQWKELYRGAVAEVDGMSPEDRLTRAKEIEHEQELEAKRFQLAAHQAEQRKHQEGWSLWDESYDQAHDDELVKAKELSEEELDAAIAAVEAWEQGGKWDDAAYVRDYLIREEIVQSEEDSPTEEEDAQPDLQQWRRSYDEAAVGIDAIPENQRAERARQIEADQEKHFQELMTQWKEQAETEEVELEGTTGEWVATFARTMFSMLDILFVGLAVVTAFRIGSHGFSKGE